MTRPRRGWSSLDFVRSFFRREPRQARSRAVVDALVEALEQQLEELQDPAAWTLDALVTRAGVGVGSFYEYFTSKDALLGALVGRVTERNFQALLASVDPASQPRLEVAVRECGRAVAAAYVARPQATRLVAASIVRLDLVAIVVRERDRFARELAARAGAWLPGEDPAALEATMVLVCDALMGLVTAELYRSVRPDPDRMGELLGEVGWSLITSRHPAAGR